MFCLFINNTVFKYYLDQMYFVEVEINETKERNISASYLYLLLLNRRDMQS